jgi:hypothetical protein
MVIIKRAEDGFRGGKFWVAKKKIHVRSGVSLELRIIMTNS